MVSAATAAMTMPAKNTASVEVFAWPEVTLMPLVTSKISHFARVLPCRVLAVDAKPITGG
jgi:hypothetical protein